MVTRGIEVWVGVAVAAALFPVRFSLSALRVWFGSAVVVLLEVGFG